MEMYEINKIQYSVVVFPWICGYIDEEDMLYVCLPYTKLKCIDFKNNIWDSVFKSKRGGFISWDSSWGHGFLFIS